MEAMPEIDEKADESGLSGFVFTLGTGNSACFVGFYARISGIRENPVKYMDLDGKSNTVSVAISFSWLPLIDSPVLPFGDITYLLIVGTVAAVEYLGPLMQATNSLAPQIPALIDNIQSALSGGGSPGNGWDPNKFNDKLSKIKDRITRNLSNRFNKEHLDGARAEKMGKGKIWKDGRLMDHYKEVSQELNGLKKELKHLSGAIENPNMPNDIRTKAVELLKQTTEMARHC